MTAATRFRWDWTVTLGNMLSIGTMLVAVVGSAIGLYIRYEGRLTAMEAQIVEQNKSVGSVLKQMEAHAQAMVNIRHEQAEIDKKRVNDIAALDQRRLAENVSYSQYVKGMEEAAADRRRIEARIEATAQEFKHGLSEIKTLLRDQTRVEEQRFLAIQQRMDAFRDQRDAVPSVPRR